MLEYLRVKNFALLENIDMELSEGLNIITGESGSGKSFVIKSILFVLGHKASASLVRTGCEKASVEALFIYNNEELIIRREISAQSGRSRYFINDVLSSQERIKEIREDLLLYTSQHAQHKLLQPLYHTELLDAFLGNEELLLKRDLILQELRICRKQQEEVEEKYKVLSERRELLEFQQSEIEKVNPSVEEEEYLENQKQEYKKAKESIDLINKIRSILQGSQEFSLQEQLHTLLHSLQDIVKTYPQYQEAVFRVEEMIGKLYEVEQCIEMPSFLVPECDIDSIEARLFELSKLKRSLRRNIAEICQFQEEISENLSFLDSCELEIKHLKKEEERYKEELLEVLSQLQHVRYEGASLLSSKIEESIIPLGFSSGAKVVFSFQAQQIWEGCFEDKARILFCPNIGHPAMPLDTIASGGELSRLLLAISSIMASSSSQTLIFDEVDTGIGGKTLQQVAEALVSLSKERQLLVITHWGNVAQYADRHFFVEKSVQDNMTTTYVRVLEEGERKEELIRMQGEV